MQDIINPNENLIIPEWINETYFEHVLAKDEPNYVKVLSFCPVAAIPPGENFTSAMLRVYFELEMNDGSIKTTTYILKTMLPKDKGGDEIAEFGLFPKEMMMYNTFLPAFETLYKEAGEDIKLAPKCLHTDESDGCINFIFEDLAIKKFRNVDRTKGLDLEHMICALQKLAEFHAAGSTYLDHNFSFPSEFDEGFVTHRGKKFHFEGYAKKEKSFKNSIATWGLPDTDEYIKNFYWAQCLSSMEVDPEEFNTLTHGDFWSSNLMCNYKPSGSINQLILVDFQICKWGSPAIDLLFFLSLSAANDIRIKKFDYFVRIYWDRLIECLKLLKYKKKLPKLRDIHGSMYKKNNSFYAFFALFNHLPLILFPSEKNSNLHELMGDSEEAERLRQRIASNPALCDVLKDTYPFFYNRGLFNFEDYEKEP
ncbi:CG31288 [Drosophila busckii]|uniref:CG31288 n=1 Tax=Drosophila busckii TaxID=30019 RepID=A0A0M4EHC1_DROBS|nr:CG31288 [Drosophila busckii]